MLFKCKIPFCFFFFLQELPWIFYMGHLFSKNGLRLKKRTRKLQHKKKKKRNCFLQGPCMLCFLVHSNSSGLDDDGDHLEAGVNGCCHNTITGISVAHIGGVGLGPAAASKLAERYATIASPEECSKYLLSPRELGIWEGQGRGILSAVPAKLIPAPALFRTAGVSVTVPIPVPIPNCTVDYTEMVGINLTLKRCSRNLWWWVKLFCFMAPSAGYSWRSKYSYFDHLFKREVCVWAWKKAG